MSTFEIADKLFGATYIAFMRLMGMSVLQISNLFSIEIESIDEYIITQKMSSGQSKAESV